MATLRTVIVDRDASFPGYDYTTFSSAEGTEQGDLRAGSGSDEYVEIECYATSGTADTTPTAVDGWDTDSTHYIEMNTPFGEYRHDGDWDSSIYTFEVVNTNALGTYEDYVRFIGLQLMLGTVSGDGQNLFTVATASAASEIRIEKCILRGAGDGGNWQRLLTSVDADVKFYISNNIIYDVDTTQVSSNAIYGVGTYYIYNNTIIGGYYGFRSNSGTQDLINNILQDQGQSAFYSAVTSLSGYNVIDTPANLFSAAGTTHATGTTDDVSSGHLIDDGSGDFINDGVQVGSVVKNTTDTTFTHVTVVTATDLTLNDDRFTSGEGYEIYTNKIGTVSFEGSTYLLASGDTAAKDMGVDLSSDGNYEITDDILDTVRPQ